jgi:hypothetical protein
MTDNEASEDRLMEIALHQAGHGVIGYKLYEDFGDLSIERRPGILCACANETKWEVRY